MTDIIVEGSDGNSLISFIGSTDPKDVLKAHGFDPNEESYTVKE